MLKKKRIWFVVLPILLLVFYLATYWWQQNQKILGSDPLVWAEDIANLTRSQPAGQLEEPLLFVGSSSIRLFADLDSYFPDQPIVKQGFGGAKISDVRHYQRELIVQYQPATIAIYLGANDILFSDQALTKIAADYRTLVAELHQQLPHTLIILIPLRPLADEPQWQRFQTFNQMLTDWVTESAYLHIVTTNAALLNANGSANTDLLRFDGLHLNTQGYALWGSALAQNIAAILNKAP